MKGPLELEPKEMRTLGYQVVDRLVDHFARLDELPVSRIGSRENLEALLREPLPEEPMGAVEVLDQAMESVFSHLMLTTHRRFLAYVPSPSNFVSVMADTLVSGFNPFAGTWLEASGPAQVELVVIDWLLDMAAFPESGGGLFTSGGSAANLTALAVARHVLLGEDALKGVAYFSDQTHSSVLRALRILGFRRDQVRILKSDEDYRLPLDVLKAAVEEDRLAGRQPFCVVANAGTTNTGAVDPLAELGAWCRDEGLWLHVDGAFGAAAVLTGEGRSSLAGLGEADSLVIDPHKWLFQPYEIGCLLVRDESNLVAAFEIMPEYLRDLEARAGEVNFSDRGLQLTRSFRAFKLWMSLKVFGAEAFRAGVRRGIALAEQAQELIRQAPDLEIVTQAQLGVVTFRYHPPGAPDEGLDELNHRLMAAIIADGRAMLSTTELRGLTVLRMCTINPRTSDQDLARVIDLVRQIGSAQWRGGREGANDE